jgi:transcriptional regulator with XRE-family HTH domain
MPRKRNRAPFASFGADTKEARIALGYTQKSLAEAIGIDPRYLANIENSGALPSLPVFYEIVRLCKLPVERYFHPEAEASRGSKKRERTALKLTVCPGKYLPIVESTIDAAIKLDETEDG